MKNKDERFPKQQCHYCSKIVRRLGKHMFQKHLYDIGYRDGFDDHRIAQFDIPEYLDGYNQGWLDS